MREEIELRERITNAHDRLEKIKQRRRDLNVALQKEQQILQQLHSRLHNILKSARGIGENL